MDIRIKKINLICRRYENFDSNRKSAELYSYKEEISSHYTFLTDSATNIGKWGLKIFSLKEEPGIGLYYDFIMETWSYIREMMYFEMPNDGSVYIPPNVIINNQYVKFQLVDYYLSCCLLKEDYDKVFTLAEHALICKNVIASKLLPMLEQQKEFYQSVNMDKKSEEDEQCLKELENMCNVFLYKGFEASVKKKDISATEIIDKGSVFLEQVDQFSLEGFVKVAFTMLRCLALEKHLKNGEELDSLIEKLDSLVVNIMDNIDEEADTTLFCECHLSQIFINYLLVESKEDVSRKNNLVNLEELLDYLYQMYPLYENVNVLSLLELRVLNKVISLSCYHKDDTEKILNYVERIKSVGKYYRNNRDVQELTAALNAAGNYCYKGLLDIPRKFSFFSDAIGVIEDIYAMNNIELTNSEIRSLWKRGQKLNESKWFLQGRVFAGQSEL